MRFTLEDRISVPKQEFTVEFKQDAVRLIRTTGKSCAQIPCDLGVPAHYAVRWKKQQDTQTTPSPGGESLPFQVGARSGLGKVKQNVAP